MSGQFTHRVPFSTARRGGTLAVHEQVCLARAGRESKVLAKDGEISQKNLTGLPSSQRA